jgi:cobalt-zinc-cadmium efflux system outer membrane protein
MRFSYCVTAAILFAGICGKHASAQEGQRPPLPDAGPMLTQRLAIEKLRQDNLQLAAAKLDLTATRADVISAGLLPNPALSVGANFLAHGVLTGGEGDVTAVLSQQLPIAGQVGLRKDAAQAFATASEREYAAIAWGLIGDMRKAYVDLQIAQARWRVLAASTGDLDRVEAVISERAAAGANPQYDKIRVGVEKSNLESRLAEARADLVSARTALAQAIGKNVDAKGLAASEDTEEPPDPPRDVPALVKRGLSQRPEVAAAQLRTTASELRVKSLRREYVPSPTVGVGYNRWYNVPGADGGGGQFYAGIAVPLPIFDHGQGTIDRGVAEAQASRTRKEAVDLTVAREIEQAAKTMTVRVDAWRRYRDATSAGVERMRQIAELSYREGRASILELLDAYSTYLSTREHALELRGAALKAAVDLERALGPVPR